MRTTHKKAGPIRVTAGQLAKVGVQIVGMVHHVEDQHSSLTLRCTQCGTEWSLNLITGGRLPPDYWKCPNGCNAAK
jgi:hypothetical protein